MASLRSGSSKVTRNGITAPDHISYGSSNLDQLGYGEETQRNFAIMSAEATAHCPSVASRFHYMMGNQVCNTGVIGGEMAGAAAAGYPMPNTSQYGTDDAPYYFVNTAESGSLEAQAAAYAAAYFSAVPAIVGPSGTGLHRYWKQRLGDDWIEQLSQFLRRGAEFRRWSRNYGTVLSVGGWLSFCGVDGAKLVARPATAASSNSK